MQKKIQKKIEEKEKNLGELSYFTAALSKQKKADRNLMHTVIGKNILSFEKTHIICHPHHHRHQLLHPLLPSSLQPLM